MDDEPTASGDTRDGDEQPVPVVAEEIVVLEEEGSDLDPTGEIEIVSDDEYDENDPEGLGPFADGEDDDHSERRNALPRRVDSWRKRSASGAIATAMAMGLQQVFEPEKRMPAVTAEAPSEPYADDDPITVDYVPDDARATTVHLKPWLLEKDNSA